MAKIQDDILEKFFADLENTDGFTKERVDALRTLFTGAKKPKATDFVRVLKDQPKDQQLP